MKFCPHCGGDLSQYLAVEGGAVTPVSTTRAIAVQRKYDQTATWRSLMQRVREVGANPPDVAELGLAAADSLRGLLSKGPVSTIVHLVFAQNVVPQGGVLYQAAMSDGRIGSDDDQLEVLGYCVDDGKVRMVDDVPVGPIYQVLDYWGGVKQHRRWHLAEPVTINPSRHGEPFFMDDNMVAFGAKWGDGGKLDEGILELLTLLDRGIGGVGAIARPVAMELVAQPS